LEYPAGGHVVVLKKVLLTTDLSDYSLAALEYASTLGLLYGAKVYVLYVEESTPPPMYSVWAADEDAERFRARTLADAHDRLENFMRQRVVPMIAPANLHLEMVLRSGDAVAEIRRFAEEERIDLIVTATHGRTGLKHVLLGSVAEKLVRVSTVPVLTVKPASMVERVLEEEDVESELHMR
jgi:nucleotide-binding universal stress UspA family protein